MTVKRLTILLAVAFIALAMVGVILWHNNATAQPPNQFGRWNERPEPRPRFPVSENIAICAAKGYVFIVAGNTLYKFDTTDLKLIDKAPIEREPRFRPDDRPNRMEEPFPPSKKTPETEEDR